MEASYSNSALQMLPGLSLGPPWAGSLIIKQRVRYRELDRGFSMVLTVPYTEQGTLCGSDRTVSVRGRVIKHWEPETTEHVVSV